VECGISITFIPRIAESHKEVQKNIINSNPNLVKQKL